MRIVLASSSSRRRELLKMIGLRFEVIPPNDVDESKYSSLNPEDVVVELALKKAMSVSRRLSDEAIVIGVDTLVEVDGFLLGKPSSREEAFEMISALQGKVHRVFSGIALIEVPTFKTETGYEVTRVKFSPLSPAEIERYLDSGEWVDKAGAYAIQGKASLFTEWIEGCYFNVVGLPLALLRKLMSRSGFDPLLSEVGFDR